MVPCAAATALKLGTGMRVDDPCACSRTAWMERSSGTCPAPAVSRGLGRGSFELGAGAERTPAGAGMVFAGAGICERGGRRGGDA